jgi:hypothetical protein
VGLLAILSLVVDGRGGFPYIVEAYALAAAVGGVLGGVLVPVSAWMLLRRVPFGLVFAGASLGTAAGGTLGLLLSGLDPLMAVAGAVGGYLLSAARTCTATRGVESPALISEEQHRTESTEKSARMPDPL